MRGWRSGNLCRQRAFGIYAVNTLFHVVVIHAVRRLVTGREGHVAGARHWVCVLKAAGFRHKLATGRLIADLLNEYLVARQLGPGRGATEGTLKPGAPRGLAEALFIIGLNKSSQCISSTGQRSMDVKRSVENRI